ncbi:MAG TPA: hypothetical protein VJ862_04760 [Rhodanobacteraceae bacterium]|nr:hypothetical protein [Rhodanobacteraceae bacterium]
MLRVLGGWSRTGSKGFATNLEQRRADQGAARIRRVHGLIRPAWLSWRVGRGWLFRRQQRLIVAARGNVRLEAAVAESQAADGRSGLDDLPSIKRDESCNEAVFTDERKNSGVGL